MIEHAEFRNFKALRDVSVDLERFTVFVGPNGSGKTSILEGLFYLAQLSHHGARIQDVVGGDERLFELKTGGAGGPSLGPKTPMQIEAHSAESFVRGAVYYDHNEGVRDVRRECRPEPGPRESLFGTAAFLQLAPKALAAPSYSERALPEIEPDGAGLASVLALMATGQRERFDDICRALQNVVPEISAIVVTRGRVVKPETEFITVEGKTYSRREDREYWGHEFGFRTPSAAWIPARMASEGTLLVLGLLTVIMGPNRPRLLLLDDVDRALHPKAQADLIASLRGLLASQPNMQVIATSHSPYLLDHLRPEEVRLTTARGGLVVCGRLDDHPEFERWKDAMTPGEFWSMVGEDWLAAPKAKEPAG